MTVQWRRIVFVSYHFLPFFHKVYFVVFYVKKILNLDFGMYKQNSELGTLLAINKSPRAYPASSTDP